MKKTNVLLSIASMLFFAMLIMSSCEGPQGPQGPAGPAGPQVGKDYNTLFRSRAFEAHRSGRPCV